MKSRLHSSVMPLAIASLMAFQACRKHSGDTGTSQTSNSQLTPRSTARITSQNPYNYVGVLHNGAIDSVSSIPNFKSMSAAGHFAVIEAYTAAHSNIGSISHSEISSRVDDAMSGEPDADAFVADLTQRGFPSVLAADLGELLNTVGFRPNMTVGEFMDSDEATDSIEAWETRMLAKYGASSVSMNSTVNLGTDSGRSALLLGAAAILKYSYIYWGEVQSDVTHPRHTDLDDVSTSGKPFWETKFGNWLDRSWGDVRGFVNDFEVGTGTGPNGNGKPLGIYGNLTHAYYTAVETSDRIRL